MADQLAFAALSGDYNPMHVDALAARRTQAGAPVVHGMHALLWALDALAAAELIGTRLCEIRAQFRKFIYLDASLSSTFFPNQELKEFEKVVFSFFPLQGIGPLPTSFFDSLLDFGYIWGFPRLSRGSL